DGAAELDQGITILLGGLAAQLHPTPATPSDPTTASQGAVGSLAGGAAHPDQLEVSPADA
ncbi:hypothetical protein RF647_19095, partial [Kocuria sp. CPCC 205263]